MIALATLVAGLQALQLVDEAVVGISWDAHEGRVRFEGELPASARVCLATPGAGKFMNECALHAAETWPELWRLASAAQRTRLVTLSVVKLFMTGDDWEAFDERAGIMQFEAGIDREYAEAVSLAEIATRPDVGGVERLIESRRPQTCSCQGGCCLVRNLDPARFSEDRAATPESSEDVVPF